jgi:hypothetical protein
MEALAFPSLGMIQASFTFIIDGSAIPEETTEVTLVAQQDASWQEESMERMSEPLSS